MSDLISRQAAIDAIEKLHIPEDMCVFEILSHIELAIDTLPSAQPEHHAENLLAYAHDMGVTLEQAEKELRVVQTERKTGRWMWVDGVRCSNCNHKLQTTGLPTVCPNCRAKMGGGT